MKKILIIEDDKNLNKGVSFALKKEGYEVFSAYSKKEGEREILNKDIDFLLLDINLPDGSGLDLCKEIRSKINFPIVFFTANDTEEDMVRGFEAGADDYISKPFSVEVLKYKINVILKRSNNEVNKKNKFKFKDLEVDFDKKTALIKGEDCNLTVTEYKILEVLIQNRGKVTTKEILLDKVWDIKGNFVDENTLSVNIRRLRKKIEEDSRNPKYIITVFGIGYTFGEE